MTDCNPDCLADQEAKQYAPDMTKSAIVAVTLALGVGPPAYAQAWQAKVEHVPGRSVAACGQTDVSKILWTLKLEGSTFSGSSNQGATFSTTIAPDGTVKTTYEGKLGNNTFPVQISGNARTKELESFNIRSNCLFKLVPVQ